MAGPGVLCGAPQRGSNSAGDHRCYSRLLCWHRGGTHVKPCVVLVHVSVGVKQTDKAHKVAIRGVEPMLKRRDVLKGSSVALGSERTEYAEGRDSALRGLGTDDCSAVVVIDLIKEQHASATQNLGHALRGSGLPSQWRRRQSNGSDKVRGCALTRILGLSLEVNRRTAKFYRSLGFKRASSYQRIRLRRNCLTLHTA